MLAKTSPNDLFPVLNDDTEFVLGVQDLRLVAIDLGIGIGICGTLMWIK